jgi:hypothetical protein
MQITTPSRRQVLSLFLGEAFVFLSIAVPFTICLVGLVYQLSMYLSDTVVCHLACRLPFQEANRVASTSRLAGLQETYCALSSLSNHSLCKRYKPRNPFKQCTDVPAYASTLWPAPPPAHPAPTPSCTCYQSLRDLPYTTPLHAGLMPSATS